MKITVKEQIEKEIEVDVTIPYFCKSYSAFRMFTNANTVIIVYKDSIYTCNENILDVLKFPDPCTREDFVNAYQEAVKLIHSTVEPESMVSFTPAPMPEINEAKEALMEEIDNQLK